MNWKLLGMNAIQTVVLNLALGSFSSMLKQYPQDRLNGWLVRFGRAFGPVGLRHFSELAPTEQQALLQRVPVLAGTHTDWLKPFQWVPRTATVWVGPAPSIAAVLMGNPTPPLRPIPNPGEWYILRGFMTSTTIEGVHNRIGWRWDDIDLFYELSIAFKLIQA